MAASASSTSRNAYSMVCYSREACAWRPSLFIGGSIAPPARIGPSNLHERPGARRAAEQLVEFAAGATADPVRTATEIERTSAPTGLRCDQLLFGLQDIGRLTIRSDGKSAGTGGVPRLQGTATLIGPGLSDQHRHGISAARWQAQSGIAATAIHTPPSPASSRIRNAPPSRRIWKTRHCVCGLHGRLGNPRRRSGQAT